MPSLVLDTYDVLHHSELVHNLGICLDSSVPVIAVAKGSLGENGLA